MTRLSIAIAIAALPTCATLGTRVDVENPQLVGGVHVVGLAPVQVDYLTGTVSRAASRVAMEALVREIEKSGAFRVVSADTLLAHQQPEDVGYVGKSELAYLGAETLLSAANRMHLDGVLFCSLEGYEAQSATPNDPERTDVNPLDDPSEFTFESRWTGAKVSLEVAECSSRKRVMVTRFDTMKGKSYGCAPPAEAQIADAVEGAFKPVAEEWAKAADNVR